MRRSKSIEITLLAAVAAAVQSCEPGKRTVVRHCVDEQGRVVDDDYCGPGTGAAGAAGDASAPRYHYWYGGYTPLGSHVSGGSYRPPASGNFSPRATVSRGGFGATGAAHGGGEGA